VEKDLISLYLNYKKETESPYIYHRWCIISAIGTLIGRKLFFPFGGDRIFPNMYIMIIGEPATRKSHAIKNIRKLVSQTQYEHFGPDKTTKEKFLLDLEGLPEEEPWQKEKYGKKSFTETDLFGDIEDRVPKEVWIINDEFSDFTTPGNDEFYTTLGKMWDWDDETSPYESKVKNSRSVKIWQPTISILGGITPELFTRTFPPQLLGTGFLSRMLLIHGERSGRKYTIPPVPDGELTAILVARLEKIYKDFGAGKTITYTDQAYSILDEIYKNQEDIDDVRFKTYSGRRFTQLLKLCIIIAVANNSTIITDDVVFMANTTLSAVEKMMPKALGEYGKSKNSSIMHTIIEVLSTAYEPMGFQELFKHVSRDVEKPTQLAEILASLALSHKAINVPGKGWIARKEVKKDPKFIDWSLLTEEEKGMLE